MAMKQSYQIQKGHFEGNSLRNFGNEPKPKLKMSKSNYKKSELLQNFKYSEMYTLH